MCSRYVVVVVAATLAAASLPALSKDTADPHLQAPPHADRRDQAPREAQRPMRGDHAHPEAHRRDRPRPHGDHRHGDHRHGDHRHADRRHWVDPIPDHRHFGYVLPRPSHYGVPRVYYAPPVAYFIAAPRTYYPYTAPALVLQLGDYLPPEYRSRQFVVADWDWRGLAAPPYGYQWMLLGPDNFALVAVATGQIVSLVAAR